MPTDESTFHVAMQRALQEARLWIGATSPNPPVGAVVLDKEGEILAVAAHRRAGDDHAEAALLKLCEKQKLLSRVETLVVTLEPCNHTGRTPPCCEAILAAGIRRLVVGARDPNPIVKGGGRERLRAAGVEVIEGVEAEACQMLIHAFSFAVRTGHPFVTVKRAFDPNNSMIPPAGQKTFTSAKSLTLAHRLRKKADAIVTGSGTILADTPMFSVRHVKDHEGKRRILAVLDRRGRVPDTYIRSAAERGLDIILYTDIDACFADLAARGAQDVLVEAGRALSQSILESTHWTMRIDVRSGSPADTIDVAYNHQAQIPFSQSQNIDLLLPE